MRHSGTRSQGPSTPAAITGDRLCPQSGPQPCPTTLVRTALRHSERLSTTGVIRPQTMPAIFVKGLHLGLGSFDGSCSLVQHDKTQERVWPVQKVCLRDLQPFIIEGSRYRHRRAGSPRIRIEDEAPTPEKIQVSRDFAGQDQAAGSPFRRRRRQRRSGRPAGGGSQSTDLRVARTAATTVTTTIHLSASSPPSGRAAQPSSAAKSNPKAASASAAAAASATAATAGASRAARVSRARQVVECVCCEEHTR